MSDDNNDDAESDQPATEGGSASTPPKEDIYRNLLREVLTYGDVVAGYVGVGEVAHVEEAPSPAETPPGQEPPPPLAPPEAPMAPEPEPAPGGVGLVDLTPAQITPYERIAQGLLLQEHRDFLTLRRKYGHRLLWLLIGQIVFMNAILLMVGLGVLTINRITVRYYITGTIGEIVSLVTIITTFLFSDSEFRPWRRRRPE